METAFSARLRDRCDRVWAGLHAHPFLGELARGTLPLDRLISLGAEDRGGARGMAPANVAYTSFLLATAAAGGPLEITAAILPCSWSYIEIAAGLKDEIAAHPVYSDWVAFYLQDEEADLVLNMRETFDDMTRDGAISDEKREQLAEIFMMSSRLEGMFWEMAY